MKHGRLPAVALVLLAIVAPAAAQAAAPSPGCAHLRLVAAASDARAVLASVSDVVAEDFPAVDGAVAQTFPKERLFAVDDVDASCPTAWVIVQGPEVAVRVAGVGRTRFVFRELPVTAPLSELDRERVGQVARAALTALQQDAESLDRQHALAVAGVVTPPPAKRPPPTVVHVTDSEASRLSLDRYSIGVFYGGVMNQDYFRQGPGLTLSVGGTPWRWDPEVWLDAQYLMPHEFEQPNITNQTSVARVGLSVGAEWLRVGLGVGFNREALTANSDLGATWSPAARGFVRATFFERGPFFANATLLLDAVQTKAQAVFEPTSLTTFSFYAESFWRPGFAITIGLRP